MVGFVVPKKARKRVQDHSVEEKWVRRREAYNKILQDI